MSIFIFFLCDILDLNYNYMKYDPKVWLNKTKDLPVSFWVPSGFSGCLPRIKDMQLSSIDDSIN